MPTLYRNFRITHVITGQSSLKGIIIWCTILTLKEIYMEGNKETFWLYYLQWQ